MIFDFEDHWPDFFFGLLSSIDLQTGFKMADFTSVKPHPFRSGNTHLFTLFIPA